MDSSNQTLNVTSMILPSREPPISQEINSFVNLVFELILNPTLGLAALVLNIINMIVFHTMTLSDGVTLNFFMLALFDSLIALTSFVNNTAHILRTILRAFVGYGVLEQAVQLVYTGSFYSLVFPQNCSLNATVVIAVVRCCCVAIPLKVKHLLSVRRQLAAILFLSGISTSFLLYVFSPLKLFYVPNPATNTTEGYFLGARWEMYTIFNGISTIGGFTICIACVTILSTSLSKALKFRNSSTVSTSTSADNGKTSDSVPKAKERLRNARAVRTVLLVCVIFIVCNVPTILLYILKAVVKGFEPGGKYQFANWYVIMIAETFALLSCCLNTVIYIFCNTRYRDIFFSLFRRQKEVAKGVS